MPLCCDTSNTTDIDLGIVNVESTARIELLMKRNGDIWIGIDSAELTLISPTGVASTPVEMTLETPDAGVWYYDLLVTDVTETGRWRLSVTNIDDTVIITYPYELTFEAVSQGV